MEFELRNMSPESAMKDYKKLCEEGGIRKGNVAINIFFLKHMLKTKTKRGESFIEWLDKPKQPYYQKFFKTYGESFKVQYRAFELYSGSINAFKPTIAKNFYKLYNPKTVLDPTAGWGGRCLGAMACDINYIGFDTNTNLKEAYDSLSIYPSKSKVEMHFMDSSLVDYSQFEYDMVFTSPPYYKKEFYECMPDYKDKKDFNESFLKPVVMNSFAHLAKGGIYALNIPIEMYEIVCEILGDCDTKIPLDIHNRSKAKKFGGEYKEYIYVWKKN